MNEMLMELPTLSSLDAIGDVDFDTFEAAVAQLPSVAAETIHHFADGIYVRELRIPAGTMLTGKIHKTQHVNIISAGDITVWSAEHGVRRIQAPCTFVASPGTRRAGFAHADTVWSTVHASKETDLDLLEAELIEPYSNPLLTNGEQQCLGQQS